MYRNRPTYIEIKVQKHSNIIDELNYLKKNFF